VRPQRGRPPSGNDRCPCQAARYPVPDLGGHPGDGRPPSSRTDFPDCAGDPLLHLRLAVGRRHPEWPSAVSDRLLGNAAVAPRSARSEAALGSCTRPAGPDRYRAPSVARRSSDSTEAEDPPLRPTTLLRRPQSGTTGGAVTGRGKRGGRRGDGSARGAGYRWPGVRSGAAAPHCRGGEHAPRPPGEAPRGSRELDGNPGTHTPAPVQPGAGADNGGSTHERSTQV
jgi:hypothetical protein